MYYNAKYKEYLMSIYCNPTYLEILPTKHSSLELRRESGNKWKSNNTTKFLYYNSYIGHICSDFKHSSNTTCCMIA